jgi:hypothetical protein
MDKTAKLVVGVVFVCAVVAIVFTFVKTRAGKPTAPISQFETTTLNSGKYTDPRLGYSIDLPEGINEQATADGSRVYVGEIFSIQVLSENADAWMEANGGRANFSLTNLHGLKAFTTHLTSEVADQDIYVIEKNNATVVLYVVSGKPSAKQILDSFVWK